MSEPAADRRIPDLPDTVEKMAEYRALMAAAAGVHCEPADVETQIAELRKMLGGSTSHTRTVVRPSVPHGLAVDLATGARFADHAPGPVTIVTFYISHRMETEPVARCV